MGTANRQLKPVISAGITSSRAYTKPLMGNKPVVVE
jgi:hypothetical protein